MTWQCLWHVAACAALFIGLGAHGSDAASPHYGQVMFGGLPVPGASVAASQGDTQRITVTDQQGLYRFAALEEGVWTIRVEMLGFVTVSRDITIAGDSSPEIFELIIRPFDDI